MKKLSNLMGVMWEADPNKSLWSLMTKAWSMIRDQIGKNKAPLDQFFRIICPHLNMPSPETYLERYGWELSLDKEGAPALSRETVPQPDPLGVGIANMALSAEDIIDYCQSMGYAQEYVSVMNTASPTLLGHFVRHIAGKSSPIATSTQTSGPAHEARVAARNKRRAKRQSMRDTGIAPVLQEQIFNAHVADKSDVSQGDGSNALRYESVRFYSQLADILTNHDDVNATFSSGTTSDFTSSTDVPGWVDWGAFRLGADENAILPSFGSSSL